MVDDIIKCTVEIEQIRFYKDDWGILIASVNQIKSGTPAYDRKGFITLKGTMAEPKVGNQYFLTASEVDDPTYGKQYEIKCMANIVDIDTTDKIGQKRYLLTLFTEGQVEAMYEALDDPFKTLNDEDIQSLIKVKGCGVTNAVKWTDKFSKNLHMSKMYVELEEYGLTTNMLMKLLNKYKQPDLVIQKVKENPYVLSEVKGIGWKKCDEIALAGGLGKFNVERIKALILYYLEQQAVEGFSFVSPDELMGAIVEHIGEDVPDLAIGESIHGMPDKLWWNKDKTKIGLKRYRTLEENIAKDLLRIRDAESNFKYDNWEDVIKHMEHQQGWEYTDQQLEGIKMVLDNNVVCVHGYSGTGKSTIANAMLETLKMYSHALTALSGRAAARIAEITGEEGYTIHRLLGYPCMDEQAKQKFYFHDENPLPFDIIIVDEISMIGGYLFSFLLRAIRSGAKVVLLGDIGQLKSIGECNVAADIINSEHIPTLFLNQIHRQAKKSAIITDSIKIRTGSQIIEKDWAGEETRGELQDLTLDCYSDKSNTYYKTLQHFQTQFQNVVNILDIQVICPVKKIGDASTWSINNAIQDLYNPKEKRKKELAVFYGLGYTGVLREGDKVINTKNSYKTLNPETGKKTPVFNGNIGIIRSINESESTMIVDFKDIGTVLITKDMLKFIELGYAISAHRSQGSQWERVIVAIDYSSYALLSRELIYTVITRAQKHCTLVAQNSALRYATCQEGVSVKETHLVEILDELVNPVLDF